MIRTVDPAFGSARTLTTAEPAETARPVHRRAVQTWTAVLVALCVGWMWLQFRHIDSTLPYPHDIDEGFVSGPASRMLLTGTLHPYTFNYPSLPKYLAAVGMAGGFLQGASHREMRDIQELGSVGFPYYEARRPMQAARKLFALLSVVIVAATGLAAWLAFRRPAAIVLAPLVLVASPLFSYHSWAYLNVDIVGACFVALTLAACLHGARRPSIYRSAVVPGVFAGLATGSKYTLALVIAPVLLAIVLHAKPGRRITACCAALGAMVAAFLVAVPHSVLAIPEFLNGVAYEAYHYAAGHPGADGPVGLPQLWYYTKHFAAEFGVVGMMLAALGACAYIGADWRRALVLLSFPAVLLWLLASQKVHFTRNVVSLHPIIAMFLAYAVIMVHGWVVTLATRRGWFPPGRERFLSIALGLVLVAGAVPLRHLAEHLRDRTDSRKLAQAWIEERLPAEWSLVVPSQLSFDTRALGPRATVVDLQGAAGDPDALHRMLQAVPGPAVILSPKWTADTRFRGQEVAAVLNEICGRWRVVKTFGSNPVLVNYSQPNPSGDPAFAIAILKEH